MEANNVMKFKRVFTIVLDSVGIGAASDATNFGDDGADTLGHIGEYFKGNFTLPNLSKLGLSNIRKDNPILGVPITETLVSYVGKMQEI